MTPSFRKQPCQVAEDGDYSADIVHKVQPAVSTFLGNHTPPQMFRNQTYKFWTSYSFKELFKRDWIASAKVYYDQVDPYERANYNIEKVGSDYLF